MQGGNLIYLTFNHGSPKTMEYKNLKLNSVRSAQLPTNPFKNLKWRLGKYPCVSSLNPFVCVLPFFSPNPAELSLRTNPFAV